MQIIPLESIPSQQLRIVLGGQNVDLNLFQKTTGMFLGCFLNGEPIFSGCLVLNGVNMIFQKYWGFVGGLVMVDTQGNSDPDYSGLGNRWQLIYLDQSEVL